MFFVSFLEVMETEKDCNDLVTILTNCFDLTEKDIGNLYCYCWKAEIFLNG